MSFTIGLFPIQRFSPAGHKQPNRRQRKHTNKNKNNLKKKRAASPHLPTVESPITVLLDAPRQQKQSFSAFKQRLCRPPCYDDCQPFLAGTAAGLRDYTLVRKEKRREEKKRSPTHHTSGDQVVARQMQNSAVLVTPFKNSHQQLHESTRVHFWLVRHVIFRRETMGMISHKCSVHSHRLVHDFWIIALQPFSIFFFFALLDKRCDVDLCFCGSMSFTLCSVFALRLASLCYT